MVNKNLKKDENFIIRNMKSNDVEPLQSAGFHYGKEKLKPPLIKKLSQFAGFSAKQTRFVAYSIKARKTVGFFSLTRHPYSLQSLRYVYIDPDFRRKGIATKIIFYAISYAKKEGAKKIFLTSSPTGPVTDLYRRCGFYQLMNSQVVWGGGIPKEFHNMKNNILFPLKIKSKGSLNLLYKIYHECVGEKWISFFGNNVNNFAYGFSQEFKKFFNKSVYVSQQRDSFVILYVRPFGHIVDAHLYISSNSKIKPLLEEIMNLFKQKKAIYSKITIFNVKNESSYTLLQKYKFYPYITIFMGKILNSP